MAHRFEEGRRTRRRRTRSLRVEPLEQRCLLAGDLVDFPALAPDLHMPLTGVVMEQLQTRAAEYGVSSADLLQIYELRHVWDVNADGSITPLDALLVINQLNRGGARQVADQSRSDVVQYDVNRDGLVSPMDALHVINGLNRRQFANRSWWQQDGGVEQVLAGILEQARSVWWNQPGEDLIESIDRAQHAVNAHLDTVMAAVDRDLSARGYEQGREELIDGIREVRQEIGLRLDRFRDLVARQNEYLADQFYRDVMPEGESSLSPQQVDMVLDRIVGHEALPEGESDDGTAAWHRDYIRELIERHIEYLRQGVDVGQIDELIVTHAEYLAHLLEIHDQEPPDLHRLGEMLDHVHEILVWLDDLDWQAEFEYWADYGGLPPAIRDHYRELVENHVGYVRELVDRHREAWGDDYDLAELVRSHIDYVRDLLAAHGVPTWWNRWGTRR
jgi:hypothetical protein